jgi:hypothetical protein
MGQFIDHAETELKLLGEDQEVIDNIALMMEVWESMGHSGGSHFALLSTLEKLMRLENLTPLTDDPSEWSLIDKDMWPDQDENAYQSLRNSAAFSNNAGLTYWLVGEPEKVYPSAKKQADGTIIEFPDAFYTIVRMYLTGDEVSESEWDRDQLRILSWNGTIDVWVVQFDVPSLGLNTFYELSYDNLIEAGAIRTFERED